MKKYRIALLAFTLTSVAALSAAIAADMSRAPEGGGGYKDAYVPVMSWTGFYLGGEIGWASQNAHTDYSAGSGPFGSPLISPALAAGLIPAHTSQDANGILGGVTGGYNFQRGSVVFGVEGDFSGLNQKSTASVSTGPIGGFPGLLTAGTVETDWLATVRGRAGFLLSPQTLLFATGGLAAGEVKASGSVTPFGGSTCANNAYCSAGEKSETLTGWTVGAGMETAFGQHWTVKVEGLYYDLGHMQYSLREASPAFPALAGTPNMNARVSVTGEVVRAGLNYHIGSSYDPLK